jgi:hypothetical protein
MKTNAISKGLGRQVREAAAGLTWERLPESILLALVHLSDSEKSNNAEHAR